MRKKHRVLWIILCIMVLVSMVMFSVLPYLNAAEVEPVATPTVATTPIDQEDERTVPPYTGQETSAVSDTEPILGPGAASVTATVPETEFNRPKPITYWLASFKNIDPYMVLLGGSVILVLVLFLVVFLFWKKTKKGDEDENEYPKESLSPISPLGTGSKDATMNNVPSEKNQGKQ